MKNLNTVSTNDVKLRLVPSANRLYEHCIQYVMRDYADVADEMNAVYAELGSDAYDDEYYAYLDKLEKAFAARIKQVVR